MPNVSVRIDDERREELDDLADNAGLSRAAYIRDALDVREEYYELREEYSELRNDYDELQSEYDELQKDYTELREEHDRCGERIENLERENERLRREKRMILEQREENTELQRYVQDELSYREAGLGTRLKWWMFGKGGGDD